MQKQLLQDKYYSVCQIRGKLTNNFLNKFNGVVL